MNETKRKIKTADALRARAKEMLAKAERMENAKALQVGKSILQLAERNPSFTAADVHQIISATSV